MCWTVSGSVPNVASITMFKKGDELKKERNDISYLSTKIYKKSVKKGQLSNEKSAIKYQKLKND